MASFAIEQQKQSLEGQQHLNHLHSGPLWERIDASLLQNRNKTEVKPWVQCVLCELCDLRQLPQPLCASLYLPPSCS